MTSKLAQSEESARKQVNKHMASGGLVGEGEHITCKLAQEMRIVILFNLPP